MHRRIAWDESGLVIPDDVGGGHFAASSVLAHEFGPAMQLPRQETTGVLRELEAHLLRRCGARWTADRGLLSA